MPDPFGSNISERDAQFFDRTMPPGKNRLNLAERLRQVRIDMDSLVAGVTHASVLAAIAQGGAPVDFNFEDVGNMGKSTTRY